MWILFIIGVNKSYRVDYRANDFIQDIKWYDFIRFDGVVN